jgi:hypothetical protein
VGDGQAALKYLAPYIYRVAISNRRLINFIDQGCIEKSQVTFEYRKSDTGQVKRCTLSVEQFLQRFLQHVLPKGFVKVRYFGFLAHNRRATLASLKTLLAQTSFTTATKPQVESDSAAPALPKFLCPACGMQEFHTGASSVCCAASRGAFAMSILSFLFLLFPSGNDYFSLSRFVIPYLPSVPSFSLIAQPVFLVRRFPRAYNQFQQDGFLKLRMLQFPNVP